MDSAVTLKERAVKTLWAFATFLVGVMLGPVIQARVFALLPGHKVDASLRAESYPSPGDLVCHYYMFRFRNLEAVDYMYVKIQLPNSITSLDVGTLAETVSGDDRRGDLQWTKGIGANGQCNAEVVNSSLRNFPDITFASTNSMVTIHSSSKLPLGTPIIGLIATTERVGDIPLKLWSEGTYEYSEFGMSLTKKLSINLIDLN